MAVNGKASGAGLIKFKRIAVGIAIFLTAAALPLSAASVYANSAAPWEDGVTSSGVRSTHESSVLQVEKEVLTFRIDNNPSQVSADEMKYSATVTAEYTFKNPTEETVYTQMAFPYGNKAYYAEEEDFVEAEITDPILVNGSPAEYTIRYSYGDFLEFYKSYSAISDDYAATDFYKRDMPVHVYSYKLDSVSDDHGGDDAGVRVAASVPATDSAKTRYIASVGNGEESFSHYGWEDYAYETFYIYVFGEDVDLTALEWSATVECSNWLGIWTTENEDCEVTCKKLSDITLEDFLLDDYDEESGISKLDWYNGAFIAHNLNDDDDDLFPTRYNSGITSSSFCGWYVYNTEVAPGGTFTNSVTAPVYPRIRYNYEPDLYTYEYYLSPAENWASFKDLTINIYTADMYLQDDVYPETEVNDLGNGVYSMHFDELPDEDLSFSLSTAKTSVYKYSSGGSGYSYEVAADVIATILILSFIVPPAIGIVVLIVFLIGLSTAPHRKHRK